MPISRRKVNGNRDTPGRKFPLFSLKKQPFRVDITPNLLYYITVIKRWHRERIQRIQKESHHDYQFRHPRQRQALP